VTEFVNQHDQEKSQVLQNIPRDRRILALSALDLVYRDKKPGPVEKDINSSKVEEPDRVPAASWHVGSVIDAG
jgi:hypothetical protein